ncbi:hypothetical protein [Bradyrhizobium tropiciagri]|uniref:hypothetical protein n=1 Tax=Bradyrhizobium tropiciagri TaxID=312253 RepID=UPI00067D3A00|nr:hypothetical protein [Bradyrhizobium tropiciagri]
MSRCGACHTPRNLLGAEKPNNAYGGAVIDNWVAPPLTAANLTPAFPSFATNQMQVPTAASECESDLDLAL